jgi:hypothetical protein
MDKAQLVFEKQGFFTAHIMDSPKNKKEYKTFGGYAREWVNRTSSGVVAGLAGGAAGTAGGATIGGLIGLALKNPQAGAGVGAMIGGTTGALAGTISGQYKSLRKTEKDMGFKKQTNVGQYLGRGLGSVVGKGVIPIVGGPVGDYLTSRQLQKHAQLGAIMKTLAPLATKALTKTKKFGMGYAKNVGKDFSTLASSEVGNAAKRKALVGLAGRVGLPGYIAADTLS